MRVGFDSRKQVGDEDPAKSQRVMQAMLQMVKLDIKRLKDAYEVTESR